MPPLFQCVTGEHPGNISDIRSRIKGLRQRTLFSSPVSNSRACAEQIGLLSSTVVLGFVCRDTLLKSFHCSDRLLRKPLDVRTPRDADIRVSEYPLNRQIVDLQIVKIRC
jgi:hypothetical protein